MASYQIASGGSLASLRGGHLLRKPAHFFVFREVQVETVDTETWGRVKHAFSSCFVVSLAEAASAKRPLLLCCISVVGWKWCSGSEASGNELSMEWGSPRHFESNKDVSCANNGSRWGVQTCVEARLTMFYCGNLSFCLTYLFPFYRNTFLGTASRGKGRGWRTIRSNTTPAA